MTALLAFLASNWKGLAVGGLLAFLAGSGAGYWKGHHDADQSATVKAQAEKIDRQDATIRAERAARLAAERMADRLAETGRKYQKELADAKAETDRLRAADDAGRVRFTIHGVCPSGMSGTAESGPGNSGTVCVLTPEARRNYFDLREGIPALEAKLRSCQEALRVVTEPAD